MKKHKKFFLLSIPLAITSFNIYMGVTIGYISALILSGKKEGEKGIIKSITFDIGKYKIHLHHWILGVSLIPICCNFTSFSDKILMGILGGISFQGIFCYKDWYKIIYRKKHDNKMSKIK
jgi:hypothetical protein